MGYGLVLVLVLHRKIRLTQLWVELSWVVAKTENLPNYITPGNDLSPERHGGGGRSGDHNCGAWVCKLYLVKCFAFGLVICARAKPFNKMHIFKPT